MSKRVRSYPAGIDLVRYGLGAAVLLLWCGGAGCFAPHAPAIELTADIEVPDRTALLFFVDGLDRQTLIDLLADGQLPNIRRHFVETGVEVQHAVASMPAITYCNAVSLLTGMFPGHHGILGNEWFDRRTLEYHDYIHASSYRSVNQHFSCRTLYEILDDQFTVNVQGHTRRGVDKTFDHVIPTGIDWYTRNYTATDRRTRYGIDHIIALARRQKRWPTIMTFYFPGVDMTAHRYGVDSEQYRTALQVTDESIGRICDAIVNSSLAGRSYRILMTDHGHVAIPDERHFDVWTWLREHHGLSVHEGRIRGKHFGSRRRALQSKDAVVIQEDSRRTAIHLRGSAGWAEAPEPAEIRRIVSGLIDQPAVLMAVTRSGAHRVRVRSRSGEALIERRLDGSRKFYKLTLLDNDPLGCAERLSSDTFHPSQWHDSRRWLQATVETCCPDFVPQVMEMMDSTRAGDIVLFAGDSWSFGGHERGAHGSCQARDMLVPMYFAGPDLPAGGRVYCARVVDIMPTILDLLGQHGRLAGAAPLDGVTIAGQLRHAVVAE